MMVLSFGAQAQDSKGDKAIHHKRKHNKEAIYGKLGLTEAQKQQMAASQLEFKNKWKELRKNEDITVKEQKEKKRAIAKEHREAINRILTTEQKSKLANIRKESMNRKKANASDRMQMMKKELNVTDAQSARLKEVNKTYRNKIVEVRKNTSLDESARKEQMISLRKQQKEEINSILTVEQQTKLKELRSSHSGRNRTR